MVTKVRKRCNKDRYSEFQSALLTLNIIGVLVFLMLPHGFAASISASRRRKYACVLRLNALLTQVPWDQIARPLRRFRARPPGWVLISMDYSRRRFSILLHHFIFLYGRSSWKNLFSDETCIFKMYTTPSCWEQFCNTVREYFSDPCGKMRESICKDQTKTNGAKTNGTETNGTKTNGENGESKHTTDPTALYQRRPLTQRRSGLQIRGSKF